MAKGMGGILAAASMEKRKELQEKNPSCPLCGEAMVFNGAVWSCIHGKADHQRWLRTLTGAAFEASKAGKIVFYVDLSTPPAARLDNWDPGLQGALLAIALKPGGQSFEDAWIFESRRGPGGATTFVATEPKTGQDWFLPSQADWEFADWVVLPEEEEPAD